LEEKRMLSNEAEEVLEILWVRIVEEGKPAVDIKELEARGGEVEAVLTELLENSSVERRKGRVLLTDKGKAEAKDVIRRHRLAERLLVDVLEMQEEGVEEAACRFEHVLPRGVDESVCTLLGHPKLCPDGNPIPPGRCCIERRERIESLICPLSQLEAGEKGRIAYMTTKKHERLQRLMVMGLVPGSRIRLVQTFPSYVIELEETQIALDRELAEEIYVRCEE